MAAPLHSSSSRAICTVAAVEELRCREQEPEMRATNATTFPPSHQRASTVPTSAPHPWSTVITHTATAVNLLSTTAASFHECEEIETRICRTSIATSTQICTAPSPHESATHLHHLHSRTAL
ncbi:hypothetical protein DEO72_LG6g1568 [Vigna unguiculata]|uniref:Uncharacterized protein n=1 Tax=Vigna unguiculata TaxID=3917 RepID=A0A4D6M8M3_VIGUN|nr:hypothetical protein DEO72_LG6g1568 [Vigna unguiculata]